VPNVNLDALLNQCHIPVLLGDTPDWPIRAVTDNSKACNAETLFVAIRGQKADGHDFLAEAAERGARVALVSQSDAPAPPGLRLLTVANTRRALALAAQCLAGDPTREMLVLAVTGTNGKTTVTYLLEAIFRAAGLKPGVIGTISYRWDGHDEPAPQTTPSPLELADRLARMKADGVGAVAIEVSSHAIDQCRADGIHFRAAALTNLTQDHLDYHATMDAYGRAKERLFSEMLADCPGAVAVLNLDDAAGRRFVQTNRAARTMGYSLYHPEAELLVQSIFFHAGGMRLDAAYQGRPLAIESPMHGLFNAVNCLTAAGLALAAELPLEAIQAGCAAMPGAPGRFEFIQAGQSFPVIVDYAHTPDSLTQALLYARGFARRHLIAVIGCGGDRDPGKRPLMGRAAARLADEVIVTNDNPRTEEPTAIAEAIVEGIKQGAGAGLQWHVQLDRREAIRQAIARATADDAVIIAGKGHEDYQILGTTKHHFDDREEARAAAARR